MQSKIKTKVARLFLLVIFSVGLTSCGTKAPYEIKSPCVSSESPLLERVPCQRRPLNSNWDIT